jgi:hypothetical protein
MLEFRYRLPDEPELDSQDPVEVGIRSLPSRVAVATIEGGGDGRSVPVLKDRVYAFGL